MSRPGRPPGRAISSLLVEFLQRELAPTPGRLGATIRLTLACTAATVPIMIHHIPHGLVVMIVMYLITKEDTTATLLGSVLGVLGVTLVSFSRCWPGRSFSKRRGAGSSSSSCSPRLDST